MSIMLRCSRRSFTAAAAATFASIGVVRAPAKAATFAYKCGGDYPAGDPISVRAVQMWKAVETETGGKLSVRFFPNNQLGSVTGMFSDLRSGALEFMLNSGAQFGGIIPVTQIENLAFAFKDIPAALAAMDGPLGTYIRAQIEAADIAVMPHIWSQGMHDLTNNVRPIRVASDLEGIKLRMPPSKIFMEMATSLGAAATPLGGNEIYSAMQTKLVDGADLPLSYVEQNHFFEVQKYLSITNHLWAGKWLIGNKAAWNELPPDIQDVVVRNSSKYAALERRDSIALEAR